MRHSDKIGRLDAEVSYSFVLDLSSDMVSDLIDAVKTVSLTLKPKLETPDGDLLTNEYIATGSESCVLCYLMEDSKILSPNSQVVRFCKGLLILRLVALF